MLQKPRTRPKGPTPTTQHGQPAEHHGLPPGGPFPWGEGLMAESRSGLAVVPRLALQANSEETCGLFWDVSDCRGAQGFGAPGAPFSTQAGGCYVIIS